MDFGAALVELRAGQRVARSGWNGPGMWVALATPDETSLITQPFLYLRDARGNHVPWTISQTDALGQDWVVIV